MNLPAERRRARLLAITVLLALAWLAALYLAMPGAASAVTPVAATAQPPDGRAGRPIVIRWSTESEVNTAGFNVYRAQDENGPWQKINARLIPGSPDPLRGGSYVYTDTNVLAGATYWYELEEVELSGRATRLERTAATAQAPGLLAGLPCAGGLPMVLVLAVGMGLIERRKGSHELR